MNFATFGTKLLVTLTPPQFGFVEGKYVEDDANGITLSDAKQIQPPGSGLPIGDCFIPWTAIVVMSFGPLPKKDATP